MFLIANNNPTGTGIGTKFGTYLGVTSSEIPKRAARFANRFP
jgi:hypothetical protein